MNDEERKPPAICIFCKLPELGRVKTRLAADIAEYLAQEGSGAQKAAAYQERANELAMHFYEGLLRWTLLNMKDVTGGQVFLNYAPDTEEARGYFGALAEEFKLAGAWPQIGHSDLGARMARAIQSRLNRGHEAAILIGSDCPAINAGIIHEAIEALEDTDLVVGPADDGGYYLIGAKKLCSELFYAMEWSHEDVLADTLDRADALRLEVEELTELSDVDDLESFCGEDREWVACITDEKAQSFAERL